MKAKQSILFATLALLPLVGCGGSSLGFQANDGSVTVIDHQGNELTICHVSKIKDTIDLPLSELLEECHVVRMDNADDALYKAWVLTPSDDFIGVRQSQNPFKLFKSNGEFISDVGAVGNGPGEYVISPYDEVIDEKNKRIYLSPFTSDRIMVFNLQGAWIKDIKLPFKLNKPKIRINNDQTISIVHMPFQADCPLAMTIDQEGNIIKQLLPPTKMISSSFDGEIFSYGCSSAFDVYHTSSDTLYHYDIEKNQLLPRFVPVFSDSDEKPILICKEMAGYYILNYYYWRNRKAEGGGLVWVDKKQKASLYCRLVNDFFGNLPANHYGFNKGWFVQNMEPTMLKELIEKHIASGKCPQSEITKLQNLAASVQENDNNILFVGKMKKMK